MTKPPKIDDIISLAKRRGFVFQGSQIYGGLANTWDYGPLGVEIKNRIKQLWWKEFVQDREDCVGLDSSILLNQKVWEASGHVGGFSDPLTDCRQCKSRYRVDKLLEAFAAKKDHAFSLEGASLETMSKTLLEWEVPCPNCGNRDFTEIRQFNLMFKTYQGVIEESQAKVYLRPETAQGIFINFKNVQTVSRKKLPFGVAQIGKVFRNEITPGNFIFRTREFEQMELEFFCHEQEATAQFNYWQETCRNWLLKIGLQESNFRLRQHSADELSHYSQATTDIEFHFPFGWGELWGIAHRGNYDLSQHQQLSGKDLQYFDPATNQHFLPHVIEPSLGVDRLFLALLVNAYHTDQIGGEERTLLKLHPSIAPIHLAVLPLTKKQTAASYKLYKDLQQQWVCDFDETGSIGKRYRRFDEVGVPYCLTYDFDSDQDQCVTVRNRDTCQQDRVAIDSLAKYLAEKMD